MNLPLELVEFEADFAPFQTKEQQAVKEVDTYQFSHSKDQIAKDGKIKGAPYMDTSDDKEQGHGIRTFINQVMNLPQGKYKVINGKIVRE